MRARTMRGLLALVTNVGDEKESGAWVLPTGKKGCLAQKKAVTARHGPNEKRPSGDRWPRELIYGDVAGVPAQR